MAYQGESVRKEGGMESVKRTGEELREEEYETENTEAQAELLTACRVLP